MFAVNARAEPPSPALGPHTTFAPDGTDHPATGWLNTARPADKNVFLGGTGNNYCAGMANAAGLTQTLAMGNIGLYQHANGNSVCTSAQRTAIWATWGGTGVTPTGQGQTLGEVNGYTTTVPTGYLAFFGGAYPNEVNMDITTGSGDGSGTYTAVTGDKFPGTVYTGFTTPTDLANTELAIGFANAAGTKSVAVFMTPNGGGEDLDDPFATAPFWANVRAIALYGGAIALDVPPTYAKNRAAPYVSMVAQMITWAVSQHIRVSLTVSPFALAADSSGNTGFCGFDPTFYENTQWLVGALAGVAPPTTQWVVENYSGGGTCTNNDIAVDGTAESLNSVALLLARTVATSPPGTTAAGSNGVADAGLMSSATPVPSVSASLSSSRVGPLRLADILGFGDMATQSSGNVQISGGNITGATDINVTVTPLFQKGIHVQGVGGTALLTVNATNDVSISTAGTHLPMTLDMGAGQINTEFIAGNLGTGAPIFLNGFHVQASGGTSSPFITADANGNLTMIGSAALAGFKMTGNVTESTASTPASSTAACSVGQHAWDASFEYRCTAANTWKRAALSTF